MSPFLRAVAASALLFTISSPMTMLSLAAETAIQNPVLDFTLVAKIAIPAVVSIKMANGNSCSGYIVTNDGYILTHHVDHENGEILVTLNDGREFTAKIIGQDPNSDIAMIKIDAKDLSKVDLGNSDDLEEGQWVAAIGNPLGLQAMLNVGVVCAKGRNNLDIENVEDFIQTDIPLNRGNSGGPLLDLDGKVVGMTTAKVTQNGFGGYTSISFAIPSNMIKHVMDQILTTSSVARDPLGLTIQAVDNDQEGVAISKVEPNSLAAWACLKPGALIISVNKKKIYSMNDYNQLLSEADKSAPILFLIKQDGIVRFISMRLD